MVCLRALLPAALTASELSAEQSRCRPGGGLAVALSLRRVVLA